MIINGKMKRVVEASVQNALSGYKALPALPIMYETWLRSVPGALPAELVTGNPSGFAMNTTAAAKARIIAVTTDHNREKPKTFFPFLSFINEAVPEANVMKITGMEMNTPRLIM